MIVLTSLWMGCALAPPAPAEPLERALAREVPAQVQGRVAVRLRSELLGFGAHGDGVLLTDGPGRMHLGVLSPLGTPKLAVHSDGLGLAVRAYQERRQWVALDADRVLHEATGGLLGLDEVLGLVVAELPLRTARVRSQVPRAGADGALVVLDGPGSATLAVDLDTAGRPHGLLATDRRGRTVTTAAWTWADPAATLPSTATVEVPLLELELSLRATSWEAADPPDAAFTLRAPEGWRTDPVEWTGATAARAALAAAWGDPSPPAVDSDPPSDRMGAEQEDR